MNGMTQLSQMILGMEQHIAFATDRKYANIVLQTVMLHALIHQHRVFY